MDKELKDKMLTKVFSNNPLDLQDVDYENVIYEESGDMEKVVIIIKELESEKRISKNCFKGVQITTAERLFELSKQNKTVHIPNWLNITPARVITMMQFHNVMKMINRGMFEVINTTKDE